MVFLSQANDCFCGALTRIRQRASMKSICFNPLPLQLPASTDLPAALAAELRGATAGGAEECALAGVFGPVVAVMLGAADGLGFSEKHCARLQLACRREFRQLGRALGKKVAAGGRAAAAAEAVGRGSDPFETLLTWCATPAVPTYAFGARLVLGHEEDDPLRSVATDLAWVFRLLCARARVRSQKEAPMMHAACEALCNGTGACKKLQDAMAVGTQLNRRISLPTMQLTRDRPLPGAGRWSRRHTEDEDCQAPGRQQRSLTVIFS